MEEVSLMHEKECSLTILEGESDMRASCAMALMSEEELTIPVAVKGQMYRALIACVATHVTLRIEVSPR